ncbi:Hypothetical protein HVR_LOCUS1262 [uncultured virus]|nr:Hypothetical protein HVR_LOCUS1262 [uncultured virus]
MVGYYSRFISEKVKFLSTWVGLDNIDFTNTKSFVNISVTNVKAEVTLIFKEKIADELHLKFNQRMNFLRKKACIVDETVTHYVFRVVDETVIHYVFRVVDETIIHYVFRVVDETIIHYIFRVVDEYVIECRHLCKISR